MVDNLKIFILAGGKGTRLWPLSRDNYPKQFIKFFDGRSLFEMTVRRSLKIVRPENIFILTSAELESLIRGELAPIHKTVLDNVICEPQGRNTLPAALLGSFMCGDDDAFVLMPSDHYIPDDKKFAADIKKAAIAAKGGRFVTIGLVPDRPETGYGYINAKKKETEAGCLKVAEFVEKPSLARANEYLRKGTYYWNSGIFIFPKKGFISEIRKHQRSCYEAYRKGFDSFLKGFSSLKAESIDYGLMEKTDKDNILMVPATFRWSDLGSFDAIYDVEEKDDNGTVKKGTGGLISIDSRNNLIFGSEKLLVTVGLEDSICVETEDAILVMKKGLGQKIKDVHQLLQAQKRPETIYSKSGYRPWGHYQVILEGQRYKIKKITVNPGAALSLQMHHHRSEHWVVIRGTAKVTLQDKDLFVHENESIYIPKSARHRLANPGKVELEIIEVQNGEYVDEDDIIRIDDQYGRVPSNKQ